MPFKKATLLLPFLLMIAAIIVIAVLVICSGNIITAKTGFNRKFLKPIIQPVYFSQKVKGLRAICGTQNDHIYFETDTAGTIVATDSTLLNTRILKFDLPEIETVQTLFTTSIDSSYCYIMAGNVPEVIQINLHSKSLRAFHLGHHLFSESVLTGNDDYILRSYEKISGKWEQILINRIIYLGRKGR
jgi:hypothetical protein